MTFSKAGGGTGKGPLQLGPLHRMPGACLFTVNDAKLLSMPYFQTFQIRETKGRFGFAPMQTERNKKEIQWLLCMLSFHSVFFLF